MQGVLMGTEGELMQTALWNGGFYLWRSGICPDMQAGINKAAELISSGLIAAKLQQIKMLLG